MLRLADSEPTDAEKTPTAPSDRAPGAAGNPGAPRGSRLGRFLKRAALAFVVLAVVAVLLAMWWVRRPWPQVDGELQVAGLQGPVEVLRDGQGVPHIYAENDHDLLFAQGFVHAQDRLWSMDHVRRLAKGTLAEVIGPPAARTDRYLRTLDLVRSAEKDLAGLEAETVELLEAYCDGINAFLAQTEDGKAVLPVEFTVFGYSPEPWQPVDILLRGKLMAWLTAENFMFEVSRARILANLSQEQVQELFPPYQDGAPVIVPPGVDGYAWLKDSNIEDLDGGLEDALGGPTANWGSNQWSIHGDRTATGKPIFANDTHLVNALPSVWYHVGLHGGSFDLVGLSLPGVPLIVAGTNGKIAWGVTDMLPDVQDFYVEELDDADNPRRFKLDGEWQDLEIRTETITVKGAEPVTFDVLHTANGPIMNDVIGRLKDFPHPLALRWAEHDGNQLLDAVIALNRAEDYESFRAALSRWHGPHMNFGYADVDGNVAYQSTGKVPIRAEGHQGLLPQPGQRSADHWQGFIPYEELPFSLNPESGAVFTANHKVVDDSYPHHLAHEWSDPYRAYRIDQMLGDRKNLDLADMQEMQLDTLSLHAEKMRPLMLRAAASTELEKEALALAEAWDLRNEIDSSGAAVYQAWYRFLVRATFGDELGEKLLDEYEDYYWVHGPVLEAEWKRSADGETGIGTPSPWFDDVTTDGVESAADTSTRALQDAVAWLEENLGPEPSSWTWGAMHTTTFIHQPIGLSGIPLVDGLVNTEPVPTPGDRFTVNAAWFATYQSKPFATSGGVSQRLIVDLADPDRSLYVQSSGQSGHLFHPLRLDQIEPWRDGAYQPLVFTRAAVEEHTVDRLSLVP